MGKRALIGCQRLPRNLQRFFQFLCISQNIPARSQLFLFALSNRSFLQFLYRFRQDNLQMFLFRFRSEQILHFFMKIQELAVCIAVFAEIQIRISVERCKMGPFIQQLRSVILAVNLQQQRTQFTHL